MAELLPHSTYPVQDVVDELRLWCNFTFADGPNDSLGQRTLRALHLLYRINPTRLRELVDSLVEAHVGSELRLRSPRNDDQEVFLEQLLQARREATDRGMESRGLGLQPGHSQTDFAPTNTQETPMSTQETPVSTQETPTRSSSSRSLPPSPISPTSSPPSGLYPEPFSNESTSGDAIRSSSGPSRLYPDLPAVESLTSRLRNLAAARLGSLTGRSEPRSSVTPTDASGVFSSTYHSASSTRNSSTRHDGASDAAGSSRAPNTRQSAGSTNRSADSSGSPQRLSVAESSIAGHASSHLRRLRQAARAEVIDAVPLVSVSQHVETDLRGLPPDAFGVKWEMLRLAAAGAYERLPTPSATSEGSSQRLIGIGNDEDPHSWALTHFGPALADTFVSPTVWQELDREHASLREGFNRAMGASSTPNPSIAPSNWHGGRVRFVVDARFEGPGKRLELTLRAPIIGPSCEARRRFGSAAFFELRAPDLRRPEKQALLEFVSKPIDLLGSVWRAWFTEDDSVHFLRTNEPLHAQRRHPPSRLFRPPALNDLWSFYDWSAPFSENSGSHLRKRIARLHLLLSSTVPVRLNPSLDIVRGSDRSGVPDIPADAGPHSSAVMTDGNGLMSRAVAQHIGRALGLGRAPSAVQARICGSKGTWTTDLGDMTSDRHSIVVRKSQLKVRHLPELDPSFALLHVNTVSRATIPGVLSWQLMNNLSDRGVHDGVLKQIVEEDVRRVTDELMMWQPGEDETLANARRRLILGVQRLGVLFGRARRERGASARATIGRNDTADAGSESLQSSAYSGWTVEDQNPAAQVEGIAVHPYSGQPMSLHEKVIRKLTAGFLPHEDAMLAADFWYVAKTSLDSRRAGFHFPCPESATMIMIPDPCGVLEEGEAFFCFSDPPIDPITGMQVDVPEGDALFARHPCLLPTDIQKCRVVHRVELLPLKDVVIFSIRGSRPTASLLGGGDYDGDRVTVIWHKPLVDHFTNAPSAFIEAPFGLDKVVDVERTTVSEFLTETESFDRHTRELAFQQHVLRALMIPTFHGAYSNIHTQSAYVNGLSHPTTVRAAHIANLGLDAAKQGYTVKRDVESADKSCWNSKAMPPWYSWMKKSQHDTPTANRATLRRLPDLPDHILDVLMIHTNIVMEECLRRVHLQRESTPTRPDPALVQAWDEFRFAAADEEAERADCETILRFVDDMQGVWVSLPRSPRKTRGSTQYRHSSASRDASVQTIDAVAARFHLELASGSDRLRSRQLRQNPALLARLKASCAYKRFHCSRFPWDVAFADLCAMKTAAVDFDRPLISVVNDVMPAFALDRRFVDATHDGRPAPQGAG